MARTFNTPEELANYVKDQMDEEMGKLPLPCKKPAKFKYGTSFRDYVAGWSNYAEVIKIPEPNRYASLNTFLDEQSQVIATGLALSDDQKKNWTVAKDSLIKVLDKYVSKSAMKKQFVKSCQQSKESIAEYGARISRLFTNAFEGKGDADLLCSVFLNGLKSDTIAIQMAAYEPQPEGTDTRFHAILKQAQELESAISCRVTEPTSSQSEVLQLSAKSSPTTSSEATSSHIQAESSEAYHNQQPRPSFETRPQESNYQQAQYPSQPQWQPLYPRAQPSWTMQTQRPTAGSSQYNRPYQPRPQSNLPNRGPICYGCGSAGHLQRYCPMRSQAMPSQAMQCYGCGRYGHGIRQCRTTQAQRSGIRQAWNMNHRNAYHPSAARPQFSNTQPQPNYQYQPRNPVPNQINKQFNPQRQVHFQQNNSAAQTTAGPSSVHLVEHEDHHQDASCDGWDEWGPYPVSELTDGSFHFSESELEDLNC